MQLLHRPEDALPSIPRAHTLDTSSPLSNVSRLPVPARSRYILIFIHSISRSSYPPARTRQRLLGSHVSRSHIVARAPSVPQPRPPVSLRSVRPFPARQNTSVYNRSVRDQRDLTVRPSPSPQVLWHQPPGGARHVPFERAGINTYSICGS